MQHGNCSIFYGHCLVPGSLSAQYGLRPTNTKRLSVVISLHHLPKAGKDLFSKIRSKPTRSKWHALLPKRIPLIKVKIQVWEMALWKWREAVYPKDSQGKVCQHCLAWRREGSSLSWPASGDSVPESSPQKTYVDYEHVVWYCGWSAADLFCLWCP